ncbi:MAG TPA: hypothetical protein VIX41_07595 [Acidimicrobiales bacterium]
MELHQYRPVPNGLSIDLETEPGYPCRAYVLSTPGDQCRVTLVGSGTWRVEILASADGVDYTPLADYGAAGSWAYDTSAVESIAVRVTEYTEGTIQATLTHGTLVAADGGGGGGALGVWVAQAHDPTHYEALTEAGPVAWDVGAAGWYESRYAVLGDVLVWNFNVYESIVGGAGDVIALLLRLPGGLTHTSVAYGTQPIVGPVLNGVETGSAIVEYSEAGPEWLSIRLPNGTPLPAGTCTLSFMGIVELTSAGGPTAASAPPRPASRRARPTSSPAPAPAPARVSTPAPATTPPPARARTGKRG